LAKHQRLSSSRAEGYDGLGMSAEWFQSGFPDHFWVGHLSVESTEGGDAAPSSEGMQDMLVLNRIQKL